MTTSTPLLTIANDQYLFDKVLPTLMREAADWGGITLTVTLHDNDDQHTGLLRKCVIDDDPYDSYISLDPPAFIYLREIKAVHVH